PPVSTGEFGHLLHIMVTQHRTPGSMAEVRREVSRRNRATPTRPRAGKIPWIPRETPPPVGWCWRSHPAPPAGLRIGRKTIGTLQCLVSGQICPASVIDGEIPAERRHPGCTDPEWS